MLEFADQEKYMTARQSKGRADRNHCETEDSASSRKSMFIHYSRPAQDVIQRKQTTPLADRLREQGIDPGAFGPDFARLTQEYDELPNTAPQRAAQQRYLHVLLNLLTERMNAGEKNPWLQTALNILQDELSFVGIQNLDASPVPPAPPWEHMSGSPYLRMIAELARLDAQTPLNALSGNKETAKPAAAGPVRNIPSQQNFSAFDMVQALTQHHLMQLRLAKSAHSKRSHNVFDTVLKLIRHTLSQEACLSHYTHNPSLTVLHSTDYLKANQILEEKAPTDLRTVSEKASISKSQDVDTAMFRNTGFVFFFLERAGAPSRSATRFGRYRYTVPLNQGLDILKDAWAILHDMANQSESDRDIIHPALAKQTESAVQGQSKSFLKLLASIFLKTEATPKSITKRKFYRPAKMENIPKLPEKFPPDFEKQLDPATPLISMLSLFLPTAKQGIFLETPDGREHDTHIHDYLSGNFLQGLNIIEGIALRAAHELTTLQECGAAEYSTIMGNKDALWDYISGMVHDVQIMVPHDVLPMQYDFIDRPRPAAGAGAAAGSAVNSEIAETGTSSAAGTIAGAPETESASTARMITRPVGARASGIRRVEGLSSNASRILSFQSKSANNCFFEAMFPLMNISGIENASALRDRFVELQNDQGLPPLPSGAPVEYQHIQQFADLFHVTVTVMAEIHDPAAPATGGRGTDATGTDAVSVETVLIDFVPSGGSQNHYYIRFLPPADPQGIGHFTGLG